MVPSGWEHLSIDQILTIGSGKDYKHLSSGDIPVYGSGGHMLNVSEYLYDGDSVCIGRKGTIDKPFFLSGKFWTVDTLFFTHSFRKTIPQYVYQYFLTINWRKYSEASGVPSLSKAIIQNIKLNLPPLPEQRKIATILGTWDKAISTTERLIDNSKQQKKALMQQLLTGKKRLLNDSGNPFEGKWEVVTLEQTAKYRRGSFPQPYGNPEWEDKVNGYPFVQVYDIDKNMKLKPSTKFRISDAAIGKSVFIPKETIIVSLQGSIGRVAITQYDAYVDRTVLLFQEFLSPMNKVFFAYVIQELFEIEKTKAPGGTIKTITKDVLSNFKILIPSLKEQQKIAAVLTNADKEIQLVEQQLADLKQEKKALMQQLLTGKRRVNV